MVVVGAGICGISAALHFERRGLRVAVVERAHVGAGASTRNAGFLMRGAAENYAAAVAQYGRELARTVWRWTEENLEGLRSEGIEGVTGYRRVPSCLLALGEEERGELERSLALLREDRFEVGWVPSGKDAAWRGRLRPLGGLLNPGDSSCNSYELMRYLASKLRGRVYEGQEVVAIGAGRDGRGVRLRTTDGVFEAPRALVCTNAYAPLLLPGMAGMVAPRRGQMIGLRPSPEWRLEYSYYANHGYEYFRQAADGSIVVGGCRRRFAEEEVGYTDETTAAVQGALERFAADLLGIEPAALPIVARWAGTMGFSPDGLPLIGPVEPETAERFEPFGSAPPEPGSVWFCGGFTGHGMSMAHRCARAAVEGMLDDVRCPLPLSRVRGLTGKA